MADTGAPAHAYEILSKLAEGGMAELFLARDAGATGARRHVVLKRVARERATDTQFVQMFLDEARLASQLRHPNIAQVFDIGRLGVSYFFTMEFVHGVTVQDLIDRIAERKTQLPVTAVLSILMGTAAGLQHAHHRTGPDGVPLDIVHRDISPSNLMVSYEGHVKIVDFGVAKAVMSGRPETQAGEIKGKVGYLSPEQCRLLKLDRRSDLYSLGVVAWEMLTGKRLWKRETAFGTMAAIATEEVPLASEYREDLPREVDAMVAKLLATEVAERYQDAGEVIEAIQACAVAARPDRALPGRASLSPVHVARLMRELFGSPLEPWLVGQAQSVEVVATPVPAELDTHDEDPSVDTIEHKLTSVFSIAHLGDDSSTNLLAIGDRANSQDEETREVQLVRTSVPGMPQYVADQPTQRDSSAHRNSIRASTEVLPTSELPGPPTEQLEVAQQHTLLGAVRPIDPADQRTLIGVDDGRSFPPATPSARQLPLAAGPITPIPNSRPLRPSLDPTAPLGTELPPRSSIRAIADSGPAVMGGSGPQHFDPPSHAKQPRWPPPPHGDLGKLRWWLLGGALLAIVLLAIVLVSRSNDARTRVVAPAPADATVQIVATTPDAAPVAREPDAQEASPLDAAADATATTDATPAADVGDVDDDDDMDELDTPMPKPVPRTKLRTKAELNAAFRMKRYKDIVTACSELGADGERAVVCTLAACRARNARAQDWYRNVAPKRREGTINICKKAGHVITDVCANDLLACRR